MSKRLLPFVASIALGPALLLAQSAVSPGFDHFYNNEYDQALAIFEAKVRTHPDSADAYNWVAQAILYREMYRDGSLESQLVTGSNAFLRRPKMEVSAEERKRFMDAVAHAIALGEDALKRNQKDIRALYAISVGHGLRANFLYLVEKSWIQSLHEAVAARKANDQILEIDPNFVDAHLIHGISEYAVGCLPAYLRLVGAVNGFHGDKEDGVKQLQLVAKQGGGNRFDAAILLAAIYRRDHRPKDAIPLLETLARTFPRNHLFLFELVQMYSDLGDKDSALKVLSQIEDAIRNKLPGFAGLPPERMQYARGNLFFWYGDLQRSLADLKQVTANSAALDLSTAVMAWLRLGQVCDLLGDHARAADAYRMTIKTAPNSEPAKEAEHYIDKSYKRKTK